MANIDIAARHAMSLEDAQHAANELAEDLSEKFEIDYGWEGDFIHFERPGADGSIEINAEIIHIQARLGLLFSFMKGKIEEEIRDYLGAHFDCSFDEPA